jgi:hypothetical protein
MGKEKKAKPTTNQPGGGIFLNRPYLWLILLCIAVYGASIWYGYAELDDSIFIREMKDYNSDLANVLKSFTRGYSTQPTIFITGPYF